MTGTRKEVEASEGVGNAMVVSAMRLPVGVASERVARDVERVSVSLLGFG